MLSVSATLLIAHAWSKFYFFVIVFSEYVNKFGSDPASTIILLIMYIPLFPSLFIWDGRSIYLSPYEPFLPYISYYVAIIIVFTS